MVHIITRILILISIMALTTIMVYSSFDFSAKENISKTDSTEKKIEVFLGKIVSADKKYIVEKDSTNQNTLTLGQNQFLSIEFGRLSSALVTSETKTLDTHILKLDGNEIVPLKEYPTIYSLYDPFQLYSLRSVQNDYLIKQTTNGSFYVGREIDGTVSVYSIDAVIRLDFLDKGSSMTNMLIFPGMYIRFDPKFNRNLADADLFRIILSMVSDGSGNDKANNTGVEFVNPRISSDSESDTFFMYRLPQFTRILFHSLHAEFAMRVAKLDDLKKYAIDFEFDIDNERDERLSNPSKKNHFLLRELVGLLSKIVNTEITKEQFSNKLKKISLESKTLAKGNSVEMTLEEFLTDARFASFGSADNEHFEEIYDEIAQTLGIAPLETRQKLFQKLSNIYSLNLSVQLKDREFSKIDTYTPTAQEIRNTLESKDIDKKDYFDIALYAFHILKKAEDDGKYFDDAIMANATYDLLSTVFLATDSYVKSINELQAYKSLSIQFYDHSLETLVNSLYSYFMKEDGDRIYFNDRFVSNDVIKIEQPDFIVNVTAFAKVVDFLFEYISNAYVNETDLRTYLNIKKSKLRLDGFVSLLGEGKYEDYVLSPYHSVKLNGISLPKISEDGESLMQETISTELSEVEVPEDTGITGIRNILGNIPAINIIKEGDYYKVNEADMQAVNPVNKLTINYKLSATFSSDLKIINNIVILYSGKTINIVTSTKDQQVITLLSQVLPNYFVSIDGIYEVNQAQVLTGDVRLYLDKAKIAIGKNIFPL